MAHLERTLGEQQNITGTTPLSATDSFVADTAETILLYLQGLLGIAIIITNLFVLVTHISKKKTSHKNVDIYVFYLAIADCLVGLFILFLTFIWGILSFPDVPRMICHIWVIMQHFSILFSALVIILLSYDRLKLVRTPLIYHRKQTHARIHSYVLWSGSVCFLYCLAIYSVYLLFPDDTANGAIDVEICIPELLKNGTYLAIVSILDFFIPFTVLLFINIGFYWKLVGSIQVMSNMQQQQQQQHRVTYSPGNQLSNDVDYHLQSEDVNVSHADTEQVKPSENARRQLQCITSITGSLDVVNANSVFKVSDDVKTSAAIDSSLGATNDHYLAHGKDQVITASLKLQTHDMSAGNMKEVVYMNAIEINSGNVSQPEKGDKRHQKAVNGVFEGKKKKEKAKLRKIAKKLSTYVGVFLVCWLPYEITACLPVYGVVVSSSVANITGLILLFNSLLNPLLYAIFNRHR